MATQSGTNKSIKNETKGRLQRLSLAALVLVVLVGVSMTGSAAAISECQELGNQGQTYEVTQPIQNDTITTCLDITASDIVLDGNGNKVNGVNETQFSTGIEVSANNVTVKNFGNVTGWQDGILLVESNNDTIVDNTANKNSQTGIQLGASDDNELTDNTADDNGNTGIRLTGSKDNDLTANMANENGGYGIWLNSESNFNNLTDNIARDNSGETSAGIYLGGLASPVNNNTLVNNTATGAQNYGIYLSQASDNELRENKANDNELYGIWLTDSSNSNELIQNEANQNGGIVGPATGIYLSDAFGNILTDNTANDNGAFGIWLSQSSDNELTDNTARFNGQYGIWLSQGSDFNVLTDNLAEFNEGGGGGTIVAEEEIDTAGIYVGGTVGGGGGADSNTLVNNTARGSEYGIWIRNSFDNDVSESLAENNEEGITLEITSGGGEGGLLSTEAIASTANTFTDDTSRNNADWDFVVETPSVTRLEPTDTDISVAGAPVTNLNIGASTKPDTTLSFEANNVSLRATNNPEPDPSGLSNIGRYFEAERTAGTTNPLLIFVVGYEDADVSNVDESTLRVRRYNETAGEWQIPSSPLTLPSPPVDTADNLVAGATTEFSNFAVFGEPTKTCIDRRNLGRGQENQECPFDRSIERGESREDVDRKTGRSGRGDHRDSETARRNRGRGQRGSR